MPAFGFTVEELTGSQRSITLNGRALPMEASWEGEQRHNLTWYPGNPEATLQVLGPQENPSSFNGVWKDRFLPGTVEISGFVGIDGATLTAEQLGAAFESIRISGNLVRVQWGPLVRKGILHVLNVKPTAYSVGLSDLRWEADFVWNARGDTQTPRAAAVEDDAPQLQRSINEVDDELAFEPPTVLPNVAARVTANIGAIRSRVGGVFDSLRQVDGILRTPLTIVGDIAMNVESIRAEAEDEIGRIADVPYTQLETSDRLFDVLSVETWRRNQAYRLARLRASAQRVERRVRQQARPGALAVVVVPGNTTLRKLAIQFYNDADQWQVLADFNGITGSIVAGGTAIVVPPSPVGQGGVQRAGLST